MSFLIVEVVDLLFEVYDFSCFKILMDIGGN